MNVDKIISGQKWYNNFSKRAVIVKSVNQTDDGYSVSYVYTVDPEYTITIEANKFNTLFNQETLV